MLEKQEDIDEDKENYLPFIKSFVKYGMKNIPKIVDRFPIISVHAYSGTHNIIVIDYGSNGD